MRPIPSAIKHATQVIAEQSEEVEILEAYEAAEEFLKSEMKSKDYRNLYAMYRYLGSVIPGPMGEVLDMLAKGTMYLDNHPDAADKVSALADEIVKAAQ